MSCSCVQDAAGLAKLSASVEDVFASGNLPQAAETLAQMRRCLAVVGEVSCHLSRIFSFLFMKLRVKNLLLICSLDTVGILFTTLSGMYVYL